MVPAELAAKHLYTGLCMEFNRFSTILLGNEEPAWVTSERYLDPGWPRLPDDFPVTKLLQDVEVPEMQLALQVQVRMAFVFRYAAGFAQHQQGDFHCSNRNSSARLTSCFCVRFADKH